MERTAWLRVFGEFTACRQKKKGDLQQVARSSCHSFKRIIRRVTPKVPTVNGTNVPAAKLTLTAVQLSVLARRAHSASFQRLRLVHVLIEPQERGPIIRAKSGKLSIRGVVNSLQSRRQLQAQPEIFDAVIPEHHDRWCYFSPNATSSSSVSGM